MLSKGVCRKQKDTTVIVKWQSNNGCGKLVIRLV